MGDIFVLALTAALNPTLVAASTVMMILPNPVRLILGYLLGALLTSITLGLLIISQLEGSSTVATTKNTLSPAATIALGCIALVGAVVIGTDRRLGKRSDRAAREAKKKEKGPPRWQRAATIRPLSTQRMIWGRLTILVPGLRGGRCMTLGSGTSTMNPITTVTTTKNLQNSSCMGNSATPPFDVEDRGQQHQLEHRGQNRQLELHVGGDPAVDVAAEVDRPHKRREVVIGQDDLGRLLGDLRSASHRDADVGLLEGRCVVDGVAGHRDYVARLLHQLGQSQLVLRSDATEHMQVGKLPHDLFVGEALQLGSGQDARAEPELIGDRPGGNGVVAGDHPDIDPGSQRGADRVPGFGAQRIDDPDERDHDQILHRRHRVLDRGRHSGVVEVAGGERQHPQPLLGELLVRSRISVRTSSIGISSPRQRA